MNADDLTARLAADLRVAHALRSADRPAGLTASRVGGCLSLAARVLLEEPEGSEGDTFRAWRGSALHGALNDTLAEVDPGFTDQRGRRFAWQVPGSDLVITGETDFLLDGIPVEMKALALDTPLPTPLGWTTMAAVAVGDELLGADGLPCRVTRKSDVFVGRDCYRVDFDDASSVVCDGDHLWTTWVGPTGVSSEPRRTTSTTVEIAGRLRASRTDGRDQRIPNARPLALPGKNDLPIHPYVLGCWLGDGYHRGGTISKPDDELFEEIERCGYRVGPPHGNNPDKCPTRTVYGLQTELRQAGLLGHKHVPSAYLRASLDQRLALLQGLMDTDGTWTRSRRQATFTSCDPALSRAVYELVVSLGWRASTLTATNKGFGLTVLSHKVTFRPVDRNPFRLPRKANLVDTLADVRWARSRRRLIRAVTPTASVPVQCVEVDSSDHLYLCGEQMVPTHNTRSRNECRWHQDHGAAPDHAMQVSIAASALGAEQAFVLYLPGEGGLEESAVCEVDVGHWTREAAMWLEQADVRAEIEPLLAQGLNLAEARHRVLDSVPRDMPVRWCLSFCRYVGSCRGDYEAPLDLEIPDPTMRAAALEAERWRQVRLDAARREEAAKAMVRHVDGVVHVTPDEVVKVTQQVVGPTAERRGSKRTVVERRPG